MKKEKEKAYHTGCSFGDRSEVVLVTSTNYEVVVSNGNFVQGDVIFQDDQFVCSACGESIEG